MPLPDVLNVGWLDRSMPFSKGTVPDRFLNRLEDWFRVGRANQMRGIHECNFCRAHHWPPLPVHENPSLIIEDKTFFLGNWELWLPGPGDTVFASPALVIHYVYAHDYRPPEEYITAVMNDDAMRSWNGEVEFTRRTSVA